MSRKLLKTLVSGFCPFWTFIVDFSLFAFARWTHAQLRRNRKESWMWSLAMSVKCNHWRIGLSDVRSAAAFNGNIIKSNFLFSLFFYHFLTFMHMIFSLNITYPIRYHISSLHSYFINHFSNQSETYLKSRFHNWSLNRAQDFYTNIV